MKSSLASGFPSACMNELFGIQYQAADFFIVPPGSAAFSRIAADAPCREALSAAGNPAAPAPTTTRSYVSSQATSLASTTFRLRSIASPPLVTSRRGILLALPGGCQLLVN